MTPSVSIPLTEEAKNRWRTGKWIKNKVFQEILFDIERLIDEISDRDLPTDYFTPHDSSHCIAVEKMAKAIIGKIFPDSKELNLSELEKFILFIAVWTHDIGMIESVAQEYLKEEYSSKKKREEHEYLSALYTSYNKDFEKIFTGREEGFSESLFKSYTDAVNISIKFHRRKFSLDHCPEFLYIKDQKIRLRLIACFLRLADTLHIDSSRYNRKLFDILQIGNFDRTARLHWLKSYVVSSVYFDIAKQVIVVSVNLPELDIKTDDRLYEKRRLEENAERLKFIIKENIQEDLEAVKEILKAYELRFFESVDICINYCPGYKDEKRKEIIGILDDLDIVMSPNTSKVIRKSLDSIQALTKMEFKNYEHFHNQARQLTYHLDDVIKTRPCHIGLKKIIYLLKGIFSSYMSNDKFGNIPNSQIEIVKNKLKEKIDAVKQGRETTKNEINKKACFFLQQKKHIFLFGFSELVNGFLEYAADQNNSIKGNVCLYVFECAGKRMFSTTNSMEYNDGFHYAINLSRKGFKNIELMPDTSFASLLNYLKYVQCIELSQESCILFGANGIDKKTKDCGHTSGHLQMAIVAREFTVPVYIIADSFKLGDIDWNPKLIRDESSWLTGQKSYLDELKNNNITTKNYREDRIPFEYIKEYISDVDINNLSTQDLDLIANSITP